MDILYKIAETNQEFEDGKELFRQYADSLKIDLSFQDFSNELKTINQQYNKPKGALILAYKEGKAVGCVGIRELETDIVELKRMYVLPECRGNNIGQKLLELCIDTAKKLNYSKMRLDTLPDMTKAQNIYRAFGFCEIPAYRYNPVEGTVYMEKNLF
ncbi:MAG: GNAT family N-acetyltransferase [Bacteroidales bacterium]|nr:GNAT family N-acetyltransferase [Bacteroidales bacterium]